eukprot:XP_001693781.1 predicted protein [Chlamydomonas reinhardtii]
MMMCSQRHVTRCLVALAFLGSMGLATVATAQKAEALFLHGDWLRIAAESNAEDDCTGTSCPCLYTRWYVLLGRRHSQDPSDLLLQQRPARAMKVDTGGSSNHNAHIQPDTHNPSPLEMWVHVSRTDVCRGWHSTLTAHAAAADPRALGLSHFSVHQQAMPSSNAMPRAESGIAGRSTSGAGAQSDSTTVGAASKGQAGGMAVKAVGEVLAACTSSFDVDCVAVRVRLNVTAAAAGLSPGSPGDAGFNVASGRHDYEVPGWLWATSKGTHCLSTPLEAAAPTQQQPQAVGVEVNDADADAPLPGVAAAVSLDGMWLPVPNAALRLSFGHSRGTVGGDSGPLVPGAGRPDVGPGAAASGGGGGADGGPRRHAGRDKGHEGHAGGTRKVGRAPRVGGKAPQRTGLLS